MNIVAILQARMSSSRLPNKVLKTILDKPMLQWQIERVQQCKNINQLIIATSDKSEDQAIIKLCQKLKVTSFAGNLGNVLDRFYQAAKNANADIVIRLTGDCPLADTEIIDNAIKQHIDEQNIYTSNVEKPTFPDGLDVEVFNFSALENAWLNAKKNSELEHVTPYIRHRSDIKKGHYLAEQDNSHYRWTVDEPEDFEFVTKVYQALAPQSPFFNSQDIYQLLIQQPELTKINNNIIRNEGYLKSLNQDQESTND